MKLLTMTWMSVRKFLRWAQYIGKVNHPNGFDSEAQEFGNYLVDFSHLCVVRVAGCNERVMECKALVVLKQISCNKALEVDGISYKLYFRS